MNKGDHRRLVSAEDKERRPAPVGVGDMNGDSNVDILDSTILRRLIAGFPLP